MTTILAIETATDACSVALYCDGHCRELYEVIPRQHSHRLLPMLEELLPGGKLRAEAVDAIAYGCGPGSFTGLRIAASAVQGLAFANVLPAVPVSTLACQVQTALRLGLVHSGDKVLSMLDARVNEVYWSIFSIENDLAKLEVGPVVCTPADIVIDQRFGKLQGVGSGFNYRNDMPDAAKASLDSVSIDILPAAQDLVPLALEKYARGETQRADEVVPVYVREEVSWKKLAEQGKPV